MTASGRVRETRETAKCPFCESLRAVKFEGSNICADKRACIKRIKAL